MGVARIHFVGISGVGINALAKLSADLGFCVSGSDAKLSPLALSVGGKVYEGEDPAFAAQADALTYSLAAPLTHPEIAEATARGKKVVPRHVLLGEEAALFERSVAVAGTHGKTTTSAMLAHILRAQDKKFVALIGGESIDGSNYVKNKFAPALTEEMREALLGKLAGDEGRAYEALKSKMAADGGIFVAEACEYKRSFLALKPYVGVITNIEEDHPDCYSSLDEVKDAFARFAEGCRLKISPVPNIDGEDMAAELLGDGLCERISLSNGAEICHRGERVPLSLEVGGQYNRRNALFAIAAAYALGIDIRDSAAALEGFAGVKRRFERAKDISGKPAYFDFAHHPTEISCALERASELGKLLVVFQPHTFSRTKAYLADFADRLGRGDGELILMPTYAARETRDDGEDEGAIAREITKRYPKKRITLARDHADALDKIRASAAEHGAILLLGAGDIYALKDML